MKKSEVLKQKGVNEIKKLANRIKYEGKDKLSEGLADGIISFCNTLLDEKENSNMRIEAFKAKFFSYEKPPMQSRIGTIVEDEKAIHSKAISATSRKIPDVKYNHLVYGPFKKLPVSGNFRVIYRIRLGIVPSDFNDTLPIVRIDVFDLHGGKITLAKKDLKISDFIQRLDYNEFDLYFTYSDLNQILEYRIEILEYNLELFSDLITIIELK